MWRLMSACSSLNRPYGLCEPGFCLGAKTHDATLLARVLIHIMDQVVPVARLPVCQLQSYGTFWRDRWPIVLEAVSLTKALAPRGPTELRYDCFPAGLQNSTRTEVTAYFTGVTCREVIDPVLSRFVFLDVDDKPALKAPIKETKEAKIVTDASGGL